MPLKFRPPTLGGAIGSQALGGHRLNWPATKRLLVIGAATVALVLLVSNLDGNNRGTGPLFIAATGALVALLDFHRKDRRVFALTLSILPMAALWAWAAGSWRFTEGATDQAAALGNQASMTGAAQVPGLVAWVGMWLAGLPLTVKVVGLSLIGIVLVTRRNTVGGAS